MTVTTLKTVCVFSRHSHSRRGERERGFHCPKYTGKNVHKMTHCILGGELERRNGGEPRDSHSCATPPSPGLQAADQDRKRFLPNAMQLQYDLRNLWTAHFLPVTVAANVTVLKYMLLHLLCCCLACSCP